MSAPMHPSSASSPIALSLLLAAAPLSAQWNPAAGQWGRTAPTDLRVMTWNVLDTVCSTNPKNSTSNNWAAVVRVIASMQPDVLILQECGDNSGNGTGNNVDSVNALTTTVGLLLHGGNDPFRSGSPAVTQFVQSYAPGYDLPFVFVSTDHDGFNRNVILSRYPFADLNGDSVSTASNMPTLGADLYAPGGDGGIRGYMTAEVDLPDALYAGDLVIGNSHLKAGGGTSNHNQRVDAAANIAYYIDWFFGGGGGTVPDPRNRFADSPPATAVLGPNTFVITGGDLNEDEDTNGTKGPVEWVALAQNADGVGAFDGPDRNRSDMRYDVSVDQFDGSRNTFAGSSFKDDYLIWQDSVAALRRSFVFNSGTLPAAAVPTPLVGFPGGSSQVNVVASDHYPVIGDFVLPAPLGCNDAAQDLGFASLGSNGVFPRFSGCGGLASGQFATFSLSGAPANGVGFIGWSLSSGITRIFDGTLVPAGAIAIGPIALDPSGAASFPFAGGLGAFAVYAQWAVVDPGLPSRVVLSNALRVQFLP